MKRSEMLSIIDSLLQPWYGSSASWDEQKETCEHFLNRIEEAGMQSPNRIIRQTYNAIYTEDTWEPEDEKKEDN